MRKREIFLAILYQIILWSFVLLSFTANAQEYIDEQYKLEQFPVKSYQIENGPELEYPAIVVVLKDSLFIWQRVPTFNGYPSMLPYVMAIDTTRTIKEINRFVYLSSSPWGVDNRVVIDDIFITLEIPHILKSGKIKIIRSRLRRFYRLR